MGIIFDTIDLNNDGMIDNLEVSKHSQRSGGYIPQWADS